MATDMSNAGCRSLASVELQELSLHPDTYRHHPISILQRTVLSCQCIVGTASSKCYSFVLQS